MTADTDALDATLDRTLTVTNEERPPAPALAPGTQFGRYVILEMIGQGGMGAVYKAFDPELDRLVALKVLDQHGATQQASEVAQTRMVREAQALARLAHPNVVAIYDVGRRESHVFLAMELVEGHTLREWLGSEKRGVEHVLSVFIDAGRGLSAAHRAGLMHRDFKPDNVILGQDGRVRVVDFGLARALEGNERKDEVKPWSGPGSAASASNQASVTAQTSDAGARDNVLSAKLTQAGGLMGTPMYMAPEQVLGPQVDARADQFSFCVALFEALTGELPFRLTHVGDLQREAHWEQPLRFAREARVPGWLERVLRRGLARRPEQRYSDMAQLIEALTRSQTRRRQRLWLQAAALLAVSALVLGRELWRRDASTRCAGGAAQMASVWGRTQEDRVKRAFLATGQVHAASAWERVNAALSSYARRWSEGHRDACEATVVRADQTAQMMDLRMACLALRKRELGALVDVFTRADADTVTNAVSAVGALSTLESCADAQALVTGYEPPRADQRRVVEALRGELAAVKAVGNAGHYAEAVTRSEKLVATAARLAYEPLTAEAECALGSHLDSVRNYEPSATWLRAAYFRALAIGHTDVLAHAATTLTRVVSALDPQTVAGGDWREHARAAIRRLGDPPRLLADWHNSSGVRFYERSELAEARDEWRAALAIAERSWGQDDPATLDYTSNLGVASSRLGQYDAALGYHEKALAMRERLLGADHPDVAVSLHNIGAVYKNRGDLARAVDALRRALALKERVTPTDLANISSTTYTLANVQYARAEYADAARLYQRAFTIDEGRGHLRYAAESLLGLSRTQVATGHADDARGLLERVIEICGAQSCERSVRPAAQFALGKQLFASGKRAEGLALAQEAARRLRDQADLADDLAEVEAWLAGPGGARVAAR